MKQIIIFFAACVLLGCSKGNNNATPSMNYTQAVDSFDIQLNKKYYAAGNTSDTIIFTGDSITEIYKGATVTEKAGTVWHTPQLIKLYTTGSAGGGLPFLHAAHDTMSFYSYSPNYIRLIQSGSEFKLMPVN